MQEYYIKNNNHFYRVIKINQAEEVQEEITEDEYYMLYN